MLIEFPHTDFCIFKFWNYCLQQVLVDFPRPDSLSKENFYEDTMLLLQMIRDKRQKENQEKKVWIENLHHQDFLTGCKNTSNGLGTEEEECNM